MINLLDIFSPEEGKAVVIMPLTRVLAESELEIGNLMVFPPGSLEIIKTDSDALARNNLADLTSKTTGFSTDLFDRFTTIGFTTHVEWRKLQQHNHDDDITLLFQLSGIAERSFDLLRLHYCSLDLPDTLPGPIGVWDISTNWIGALIYFPEINKWCEVAGAASPYTTVVSGIGLDLHSCEIYDLPPSAHDGEVSAIAAHALSLLSDAMHARNDTAKFIRTMTLLEFLGSPDEYKPWQKLKGNIVCHIAKSKKEYLKNLEELRSFTSMKNSSEKEIGYRTLVIHHGKFLEEILPERDARRVLFKRLQDYCSAVIIDLLAHSHMTWGEFQELRAQKKANLGVNSAK
jgi:hypothetical protein